jgi:hypothetical protein
MYECPRNKAYLAKLASKLLLNTGKGDDFYENPQAYFADFPEAGRWSIYLTDNPTMSVALLKAEHADLSCLAGGYFPVFIYSNNVLITNGDDTRIRLYTDDPQKTVEVLKKIAPCDMHDMVDIMGFEWE